MFDEIAPEGEFNYSLPTLRPYQQKAHDTFFESEEGAIMELFTGGGKTLLAANIAKTMAEQYKGRSMFLAHTDELVSQACQAMMRMGLWPNVEKSADYNGQAYAPDTDEWKQMFPQGVPPRSWFRFNAVWVSSMQTFINRMHKYEQNPFGLLFIDEAHRSRCRTYENIVSQLKKHDGKLRLCGLTATPYREDKKNLGTIFTRYALKYPIGEGIDDGYLVSLEVLTHHAKFDDSKLKVSGDDYTDNSQGAAMASKECIESIAHPIIENLGDHKCMVFAPNIASTEAICLALNAITPGIATYIHGKVPKTERKRRVKLYRNSKFKIMVGCDCLVEGFDVPDVSMLAFARRTKSIGKKKQMAGRGLRVLSGCIDGKNTPEERRVAIAASTKPKCVILDFVNNATTDIVSAIEVVLSDMDPIKMDYIRKNLPKSDKVNITREDTELLALMYDLDQSLRNTLGPPPRIDYELREKNIYDAGGNRQKKKRDNTTPSTQQIRDAEQLFIKREAAEKMTASALDDLIVQRRSVRCGKSNYGFLMNKGIDPKANSINWYEAQYLRKMIMSRPAQQPPANWPELLTRFRNPTKKDESHG